MRETDVRTADMEGGGAVRRAAGEVELGFAAGTPSDFDILPCEPRGPAGAERLEAGFLGGEARAQAAIRSARSRQSASS